MAKNRRSSKENSPQARGSSIKRSPLLSRDGKKVGALGAGAVVIGFWILTYADPAGQNWASTLSPALLVLGYLLIGVGIALPERPTPPAPSNLPPA